MRSRTLSAACTAPGFEARDAFDAKRQAFLAAVRYMLTDARMTVEERAGEIEGTISALRQIAAEIGTLNA